MLPAKSLKPHHPKAGQLGSDDAWEVEAVLAWHDDDAKAAIRSLLDDCQHLRRQLALAERVMSRGMARGWAPRYERDAL
ncbi:hypothetical protein [Rhizobium bangladeshense]|uniref:hypothetical protein n=1 Tax=Rhizobium bangladeshense TaxID=1138189 RepID=UPI001C90D091|nr:hypothetical protein [Rhizobium bangladeshense]MBY3596920.1 hypothetical protein [Rhizobium bangladeshense]